MSVACETFRVRTTPASGRPPSRCAKATRSTSRSTTAYNWKGDPNATLSRSGRAAVRAGPRSAAAAAAGTGAAPPPGAALPPDAPPAAPPPPVAFAPYDPATGDYVGPDGNRYTQADLAHPAKQDLAVNAGPADALVVYGRAMAVSDSREVVIEATPEEILDVIADVRTAPEWSSQHQGAEILDTDENGRPGKVKLKLKTMGIADEQVVQYTWTGNSAAWTLVSSSQLKTQEAKYTLTPDGDKTKVKFEITVDPSVPIPGFVLKRAMKGGLESATDGLRKQVLKLKKGDT